MKLATYRNGDGDIRIGVVRDGDSKIFDLSAAKRAAGGDGGHFSSMLALVDAGEAALEDAAALLARYGDDVAFSAALADVRLLAPLPRPRQLRDAMSYETHIRQSGRGMRALMRRGEKADVLEAVRSEPLPPLAGIYRQSPIYYITNRMIVSGPDEAVTWPRYSRVMDYELEYAIVIGTNARNVSAADARDHIFGYTIFNDFSARDQQGIDMQGHLGPGKGKSFDGANALGPWIVTKDEIPEPQGLKAAVRVNGALRGEGTTRGMLFSFEEILAHISQDETVFAGEVIASGTIGNGCGLETGHFLEDGDVVELEIEKIGILRNKVVRQAG